VYKARRARANFRLRGKRPWLADCSQLQTAGAYSAKLADDHSKQVSEAAIAAETTARNQVVDDAKAVATAAEVNKKWEGTFDKTGKYPEGQNADTHNAAYGSIVGIAMDRPSYREARLLVDKFAVRQIKINQVERKTRK
jgi:hypothetical protein